MSIQAVAWAIETECPSPSAKLVLMCLSNYADKDGEAYPGQQRLAEDTGLSLSTIKRVLGVLEDAELIARIHRQRSDGSRTSDQYFINISKVSTRPVGTKSKVSLTPYPKCHGDRAHKGKPLFEPSVEPSENARASQFDQFWSVYPNKVGKRFAQTSFSKALKRTEFKKMMDGLMRYVAKTDDRAWCNPATWLNQDRWGDEPAMVNLPPPMLAKDTPANAARRRIEELSNERQEPHKEDPDYHQPAFGGVPQLTQRNI